MKKPKGVRIAEDAAGASDDKPIASDKPAEQKVQVVEAQQLLGDRLIFKPAGFYDDKHFAAVASAMAKERKQVEAARRVGQACIYVGIAAFALCITMLGIYCTMSPKIPEISVGAALFTWLNMEAVPPQELAQQVSSGSSDYYAAHLNYTIYFSILYHNTNKRIDIFNEYVEVEPYYYGFRLGSSRSTPFEQKRASQDIVTVVLNVEGLPLPLSVFYSINRDLLAGGLAIVLQLKAKARMSTVLGIRSPLFWVAVKCDLKLVGGSIEHQVCRHINS